MKSEAINKLFVIASENNCVDEVNEWIRDNVTQVGYGCRISSQEKRVFQGKDAYKNYIASKNNLLDNKIGVKASNMFSIREHIENPDYDYLNAELWVLKP